MPSPCLQSLLRDEAIGLLNNRTSTNQQLLREVRLASQCPTCIPLASHPATFLWQPLCAAHDPACLGVAHRPALPWTPWDRSWLTWSMRRRAVWSRRR